VRILPIVELVVTLTVVAAAADDAAGDVVVIAALGAVDDEGVELFAHPATISSNGTINQSFRIAPPVSTSRATILIAPPPERPAIGPRYYRSVTDKVAVKRDEELARSGLEAWFADRGLADPRVKLLPGPEHNGYSHETIVFDVSSEETTERLVARVEPQDVSLFPGPDLGVEYRLLEALADEPIPLPKLHGHEQSPEYLGCPFYVMQHVDARVPPEAYPLGGWLLEATPEERTQIWWSGLAALTTPHRVDWEAKGLEFVNGDDTLGLGGQLDYWKRYIDFVGRPIASSAERAWTYLDAERPSGTSVTLCWGDSRLGNQMFADGHCVALLDWEMACLSDPIQDLAWFVHCDDLFSDGLHAPRLDGIPPRDETIARYEDLTGFEAKNFDYYEIFGAFRFVVILQRLGNLQRQAGVGGVDPIDNFASQFLERLLNEKGIP